MSGDEDVEGDAGEDALEVEYYVDDRDDLAVAPDGTIEIEDVTERARIYAVAVAADGRHSPPTPSSWFRPATVQTATV